MKKLIFLLLSFVTFSLIAENSGFNSYLEKDYKKAKELFTKDFKEDMGPLVSYNLGVTSEARNKPGEAVYYYIQALQRAPELEEAKSNLDLLVKEKGITVPKKLLEPYNAVNAVLIVFFITLYLFAGLIVLYTFVPDWKIKMALLPVFLVMTVSAAFYFIAQNKKYRQYDCKLSKLKYREKIPEFLSQKEAAELFGYLERDSYLAWRGFLLY